MPCSASRSRLSGVSRPGGPNSLIRLRCMMATSGGLPGPDGHGQLGVVRVAPGEDRRLQVHLGMGPGVVGLHRLHVRCRRRRSAGSSTRAWSFAPPLRPGEARRRRRRCRAAAPAGRQRPAAARATAAPARKRAPVQRARPSSAISWLQGTRLPRPVIAVRHWQSLRSAHAQHATSRRVNECGAKLMSTCSPSTSCSAVLTLTVSGSAELLVVSGRPPVDLVARSWSGRPRHRPG